MSALAVTREQDFWDEKQLAVLNQLGIRNAKKADLALFLSYAQRTGLDPFSRQIYMIERGGRFTIQASIDGLRVIAQRSGEYTGQTAPMWCGEDGDWKDVWLSSTPPAAAKIGVWREGFVEPTVAVATLDSYMPTKKDGSPMGLWSQMPDVMLAKVAEALALRKAFPNDLSGIYTQDEMDQAGPVPQPAPVESVALEIEPEVVELDDEEMVRLTDVVLAVQQSTDESYLREIWDSHFVILDVVAPNVDVSLRQAIVDQMNVLRDGQSEAEAS